MKKTFICAIVSAGLVATLSACSGAQNNESPTETVTVTAEAKSPIPLYSDLTKNSWRVKDLKVKGELIPETTKVLLSFRDDQTLSIVGLPNLHKATQVHVDQAKGILRAEAGAMTLIGADKYINSVESLLQTIQGTGVAISRSGDSIALSTSGASLILEKTDEALHYTTPGTTASESGEFSADKSS